MTKATPFLQNTILLSYDPRPIHRDDFPKELQEHQIKNALGKIADDHAGDHFLPDRSVKDSAGKQPKHKRQQGGNQHADQDAAGAANTPMRDEDQADLAGSSTQNDGEVQAHTAKNGHEQRKDQNGVAANSRNRFLQAEFWGQGIEIVLYSLKDYDKAAVKVVNGHYTGRKEGAPLTDLALSMLRQIQHSGDNHKNLIYANKSKSGAPIRSATLPIVGKHGTIIGLLCINLYLDIPLHLFFNGLFEVGSVENLPNETFASSADELIETTLVKAREEVYANRSILSSNRNKEIIAILHDRDIFRLKNAVSKVSEMLGISRNTVYLHLRNLQNEKKGDGPLSS